jgi:hypothetical protein
MVCAVISAAGDGWFTPTSEASERSSTCSVLDYSVCTVNLPLILWHKW